MNDPQLSPSAQKVADALLKLNISCRVIELPASTRTAPEAAEAVGCQVGAIVKSLIFRGKDSQKPILILVSGSNRVDTKLIGFPPCCMSQSCGRSRISSGNTPGSPSAACRRLVSPHPVTTLIDGDLLAIRARLGRRRNSTCCI